MKYYSEKTRKFYDEEKDIIEAEKQFDDAQAAKLKAEEEKKANEAKLQEQRKSRAQEVEDAFKAVAEAKKKARELLTNFCKDYGTYYYSYKDDSLDASPFFSELGDVMNDMFIQDFFGTINNNMFKRLK